MALRFFATLALLTLGVCVGLVATMIDIYAVGAPAFIEHVTLWVFLNALLASHMESRSRVILWSIPVNFGFFLSYYIATSATYEGYPRSLVVPLSAMALLSPLLAYGLWYVKGNRGIYGKILALLTGAATAGLNYLIAGEVSVYAGVMAGLTFALLAIIPTRRLRLTPIAHPVVELSDEDGLAQDLARRKAEKRGSKRGGTTSRRTVSREDYDEIGPLERPVNAADILDTGARELEEASRAARPTRRKASGVRRSTSRSRRSQLREYERERAERRMAASERRAKDIADEQEAPRPATLGNARPVTRSRRAKGATAPIAFVSIRVSGFQHSASNLQFYPAMVSRMGRFVCLGPVENESQDSQGSDGQTLRLGCGCVVCPGRRQSSPAPVGSP